MKETKMKEILHACMIKCFLLLLVLTFFDTWAIPIPAVKASNTTRFYLEDKYPPPNFTPAFSASWTGTSQAVRRHMSIYKADAAMASATVNALSGSSEEFVLARQFISAPLAAQTISGTVRGHVRCPESNAGFNGYIAILIKVVDSAGALRGTLLALVAADAATTPPEFATSLTNRKVMDAGENTLLTLTPVDAYAGDRLVIELGIREGTTTTTYTGTISIGSNSATDLGENESDTAAYNPWVEFSADIAFQSTFFQDDFETYLFFEPWSNLEHGSGASVTNIATDSHHGVRCARSYVPSTTTYARAVLHTWVQQNLYIRFAAKMTALPSVGGKYIVLCTILNDDGDVICDIHIYYNVNHLELRLESRNGASWDYTSYAYTFQTNIWYIFRMRVYAHSTNGIYQVWLGSSDTPVIDLSGKNSLYVGNPNGADMGIPDTNLATAFQVHWDCVVWATTLPTSDVPSNLTVPSAPQNLQATAGDSKVTLTWSVPASDGGSPITRTAYTVVPLPEANPLLTQFHGPP